MKNTATFINSNLLRLLCSFLFISFFCSTTVFASRPFDKLRTRCDERSCTSSKNIVVDSTAKPIARFIVSFNSICCGIDHKKNEEFLNFIGKYKNSPTYTTYNWGEEGEMDYCFFLKEMTEKEQDVFIKKARKLLGNNRLVGTYENISCPR